MIFFFFQAEDGIRDFHVTGVQTCALPISRDRPLSENEMDAVDRAVMGRLDHEFTAVFGDGRNMETPAGRDGSAGNDGLAAKDGSAGKDGSAQDGTAGKVSRAADEDSQWAARRQAWRDALPDLVRTEASRNYGADQVREVFDRRVTEAGQPRRDLFGDHDPGPSDWVRERAFKDF